MGAARDSPDTPPGSGVRRAAALVRRFISPKVYAVALVLVVLEALSAVVRPYPIAYLVDFLQGARSGARELGAPAILSSGRAETIVLSAVAIVLIWLVNSVAGSLAAGRMARGARSLGQRLRTEMHSQLDRLSPGFSGQQRTADLLTRFTGDVRVVEEFVAGSVNALVRSGLVLLGSFGLLLYESWRVALVALVATPLLATVSHLYCRRMEAAAERQRTGDDDQAAAMQGTLTSIQLAQGSGRGTSGPRRHTSPQPAGNTEDSAAPAAQIGARLRIATALVEAAAIAAVIVIAGWLVDREALTIGSLVLVALLVQNMFGPTRQIVAEWSKVGAWSTSAGRIDDLLDRAVVVRDRPDAAPAPPLSGKLAIRGVAFTYPAEWAGDATTQQRVPVLRDVDLEVAPGEVVALVGVGGAGKSTIAQLVPRMYDPDSGAVLVDDIDVRDLTLDSLRSQIGLVLPDTGVLNGTIAENIGYGVAEVTQDRIEAAARMANAHAFITALPDGYQTRLGDGHASLPLGQRQRLAVARAVIRETPILILDEPTAGLDLESTPLVIGALRNLLRSRTALVISRDLGLIRGADRILVVSAGRIVESGTHEALIAAGGSYADLYCRYLSYGGSRPRTAESETGPGPRQHDERSGPADRRTQPVARDGEPLRDLRQSVLVGATASPNGGGAPAGSPSSSAARPQAAQPAPQQTAAPEPAVPAPARSARFSIVQRAVIAVSALVVLADLVILLIRG